MRAQWHLGVFAVGLLGIVPGHAAESTDLPPPSGSGIERGVAIVRCATPEQEVFWSSRAAILDVAATLDVLLTTAHGLPLEVEQVLHDCRVLVRGKPQTIVEVWRGGDRATPEADWAVLLTRRIGGHVQRWRAARPSLEWLVGAVAQQAPVRLVLRYADAAQSDCHLEPRTLDLQRLIAHSCVTYPGTSGSPLVMAIDGEPTLIGIHLGTQLLFDGRKLDFVSVARPVDGEVGAAVASAIARAATLPPPRRRARR
jgi:hypothetical protein